MGSSVDDALDRLYVMADRAAGKDVRAVDLAAITTVSKELERLREERDEYAERLAWHREERDAYLKGNVWVTRAAEEQARAEAAEADSRLAREQRDKLEEINERLAVELREALQYPSDMRDNAAEAEVRRLREGLREIEDAALKAAQLLPMTLSTSVEADHRDDHAGWAGWLLRHKVLPVARALLSASPPVGGGAK